YREHAIESDPVAIVLLPHNAAGDRLEPGEADDYLCVGAEARVSLDAHPTLRNVERSSSVDVGVLTNPGDAAELDPRHPGLRPFSGRGQQGDDINRLVEGAADETLLDPPCDAADHLAILEFDRDGGAGGDRGIRPDQHAAR